MQMKRKYLIKAKKYTNNINNGINDITDPKIKTFPVKFQQMDKNKEYNVKDTQYDIELTSGLYDAETIYNECVKKRDNYSLDDDEYRRRHYHK